VLNALETSQCDDKRLTVSLKREDDAYLLKVISNGPLCAVCSTVGWDETQAFLQLLTCNGFGGFLKFLSALHATFRACSHDKETWLLLRFEQLDA